MPLILLTAIPIVTVCYLLVNLSFFAILSPDQILNAQAVGVVSICRRLCGLIESSMPVATYIVKHKSSFISNVSTGAQKKRTHGEIWRIEGEGGTGHPSNT